MQIFRIEKRKFLPTILDGVAGEKFAFRWNTKGHPVVYAAETRSLALIEKLANLSITVGRIPLDYVIATIDVPHGAYRRIDPETLLPGWNDISGYHPRTQEIGDAFLDGDELICFVPSVIVAGEFNVLLNPRAIDTKRVRVEQEEIDERLLVHGG